MGVAPTPTRGPASWGDFAAGFGCLPETHPATTGAQILRARCRRRNRDVPRRRYRRRQCSVEPAMGYLKTVQGCRQFLLRSVAKVDPEWRFHCAVANLARVLRRADRMTTPGRRGRVSQGTLEARPGDGLGRRPSRHALGPAGPPPPESLFRHRLPPRPASDNPVRGV